MSESFRVAVLIGSLRQAAHSRKLALALMQRAPRSLSCQIVEIGDLPLYNEDLDQATPPAAWQKFRAELRSAQAVLFVTPEYNRSVPGCLKNALDVGSRPARESVFDGKPAGVASITPYQLGGMAANHALRQSLIYLNMPVMQQPEAYIPRAAEMMAEDASVRNPDSAEVLEQFMHAFERWIKTVRQVDSSRDFGAFLRQRQQIANDYVNGDTASLRAILTNDDPATYFSPKGDSQHGAEALRARYDTDAKIFRPGGTTRLEILQSAASGDFAFWTGLQHAEVRLGEGTDRTPMTLRVTEVYRFEDDCYRLVHRHADIAKG